MTWLERLNSGPGRIPLGRGTVELLHWAYQKHLPDNLPHRHTFFEVCLVGAHGQGRFIVQGTEHALRPGDLFIARPGVIHQILNDTDPHMELFWVGYQWNPAEDGATDEAGALMRAFAESTDLVKADDENRLATLWDAMRVVASGKPRPGDEMQMGGLITSLVLGIAQAASGPHAIVHGADGAATPDVSVIRHAVRFIHDNLYRQLSVPEIASMVHVSPRHLTRLFLQFAETSPADYITKARLDRASGMLLRTALPIKEVASLAGYSDIHYFTRMFARRFGIPPGTYRQNKGEGSVLKIHKHGAMV